MTHPALRQAVNRHADRQATRIADAAHFPQGFLATVTTVTAGGASDGNALVAVKWFGNVVTVNGYVNTYTPVVGDRVWCGYDGRQIVVVGRVIGKP